MRDVLVILMTLGFFAVCLGYVALCDRVIGPDPQIDPAADSATDTTTDTATEPAVTR